MLKNKLQNKVILVTGAGSGIGRVIAKGFAEQGASVILLGKTIPSLESLYDEIVANHWPQPAIYPMNLETATPTAFTELANNIHNEFGQLDGVVHNAAKFHGLTPIEHYSAQEWYGTLQVNLNAPWMLTQSTLKLLKQSPAGRLLFTISDNHLVGKAYWGAYSVAQAAILNLMQILADELENNVNLRINAINPGKIRTALRARAYPIEDFSQFLLPEALLDTYLFLMGPDSETIHGQVIHAPLSI